MSGKKCGHVVTELMTSKYYRTSIHDNQKVEIRSKSLNKNDKIQEVIRYI